MSEIIASLAKKGSEAVLSLAVDSLSASLKKFGKEKNVEFPGTAFSLPVSFALLGKEIKTLGGMEFVLSEAKRLSENKPADLFIPELGGLLNPGLSTLLSAEVIAAIRYLEGAAPEDGFAGFISDAALRSLGVQLVDGRISGVAVIIGQAPDSKSAVNLIREAQKKNLISFLVGNTKGKSLKEQLDAEGVEQSLDTYVVPLGKDIVSAIYAVNFAIRAALSFGGIKKGEWQKCLEYCRKRLPVFCVALEYVDEITCAAGTGALALGIPIITNDKNVPPVGKTPVTPYEAVVVEEKTSELIAKGMEAKDIKIKILNIDIPVSYSAAFEGERVRREQMFAQFGGKYSDAFEYVKMTDPEKIEDGKIEVIGPEIDDIEEGSATPLGIVAEVAGRKMQKDFEPILERQIHSFLNEAMGIFHMGQRNMCWIRISKDAKNKGFKLRHFGIILHARFHDVFSSIADKVQITIYTGQEDVEKAVKEACISYNERDARVAGMTDESVDRFWTCTLCQSFAPNHVCVVKPERIGLCGAYNWLDAKASNELNPSGPNQPVEKGQCIDPVRGEWAGMNEAVKLKSNGTIERFCGYSVMTYPETSCGCFECIVAILPEANGFMIVNREYAGQTPAGMAFSTLAGATGGGQQTPGFMGIGRLYITSKKFISAEGGLKRIVWMTKDLKEALADKLQERAKEIGCPDLIEKIADETVATSAEGLLEYLKKVNHPALVMEPLI
ncbi:MAG: CO dehydrogenase/CO-methylating acetyl-CoA synthase complex subunit beta [Candidatus Omnitrophica bacterium]|nr:CO dehydrogenase/CO-methylating acetyl-CoA synthase complex subunit beta [Candidatus Omnitrophota bacterium]